jgi:predicted TIM-barrel fold metal-dependent hydrolase
MAAKEGAAKAKERVIDADGHFFEGDAVWKKHLDKRFMSAMPKLVTDNQGRIRRVIGNEMLPYIPRDPNVKQMNQVEGAASPKARIADMDRGGVDVMVNYPTTGLLFGGVKDVPTLVALCRAYNDWAAEFVAYDPKRLIAPAVVPQASVDETLAETKRAMKLGLSGIMMRPNPIGGRTLDNPALEPVWELLEEYRAPLVLHEGTTQNLPQVGLDRYENFLFRHMVSHPFEQQMGLMELICGGVLERHPKLHVLIVECGCAWAPYWLDRMDDHLEHWGFASRPLELSATEYFKRQVFLAAEGNERLLPLTVQALGDENLCFSTDYPHPDHPFEGVVGELKRMKGLSESSKRKILSENAARLFRI